MVISVKDFLIIVFLAVIILGGCGSQELLREKERNCDMERINIENEINFYGVWSIEKVALQSKMYTGTAMDGDFEENVCDPADYIGMEVEYNPEYFRPGTERYPNPEYIMSSRTVKEVNEEGDFYNPDLYEFILKNEIQIYDENNCKNLSEVQLFQIEVKFNEEVNYDNLDFIPVGMQSIVLNENTMLIGLWGKILLAYRIERL